MNINEVGGNSMSESAVQLPEYVCHKRVHAAKITKITALEERESVECAPASRLHFEEIGGYHDADKLWMNRFKPETGGYFVVYQDGYTSFSPAKAFEEGYTRL